MEWRGESACESSREGSSESDNKGAIQGEMAPKNFSILVTTNQRDRLVLYIIGVGVQPLSVQRHSF